MDIITYFQVSGVGQLVRVNDVDLLIELDDVKVLPDFLIKEKREYKKDYTHFIILTLDHVGSDREYLLVASIYQGACDVKFYKKPDFFTPDKREVLQNSDLDWLFDFDNYPQEIYCDDITFVKKVQNEMFGEACIVEWITDAQIVDYQMLVIEEGWRHEGGGWVEFYEGRQIKETDVVF
jgi:hypothetical protein